MEGSECVEGDDAKEEGEENGKEYGEKGKCGEMDKGDVNANC